MPGQEDGNAIAGILFGDYNPSARLPVTFPPSEDLIPVNTTAQYPGKSWHRDVTRKASTTKPIIVRNYLLDTDGMTLIILSLYSHLDMDYRILFSDIVSDILNITDTPLSDIQDLPFWEILKLVLISHSLSKILETMLEKRFDVFSKIKSEMK